MNHNNRIAFRHLAFAAGITAALGVQCLNRNQIRRAADLQSPHFRGRWGKHNGRNPGAFGHSHINRSNEKSA